MLTILENYQISPSPSAVGRRSLPLTFLDIQWLLHFPIHQLFFYDFPHPKPQFIQTVLPNLNHSLSLTLGQFFPFAGNLIIFPNPTQKPEIRHGDGDSVTLTFAESSSDFTNLTANHPRDCDKFYPLVPFLGRAVKTIDHLLTIPVFSGQVTVFPNSGFSIGITNHHVLCDASSKYEFLKTWTSIARRNTDELCLPFYDRVIKYPDSLDEMLLSQLRVENLVNEYQPSRLVGPTDKVRVTVVLPRAKINGFKQWVSNQLPNLEYVSSFTVTCGYVWSCIAKSRAETGEEKGENDLERFVCTADCRGRLDPPIPRAYFGNCVAPCIATIRTQLLLGNGGFLVAVEAIGEAVMAMVKEKNVAVRDAEGWFEELFIGRGKIPVKIGVAGTPKVRIYDVDFGWGKPRKYETVSIDQNGSISVNACRDSCEDFEIGLALPAKQMDVFVNIFMNGLTVDV